MSAHQDRSAPLPSKLTPKQERFCTHYIESGNASDAYRQAYSAHQSKPQTIHREAKRLIDQPKIAHRIAQLQDFSSKQAKVKLEAHLEDLKAIRNGAVRDERWSAAIAAEVARGKASRLYEKEIEKSGPMHIVIRGGFPDLHK